MSQRMNSNTGTTGTVPLSGQNIPTYKGIGWVPDSLVAAALTAGWTPVIVPGVNDRPNPATVRTSTYQNASGAPGAILGMVPASMIADTLSHPGGFLCCVTAHPVLPIESRVGYGQASAGVYDCSQPQDPTSANLLAGFTANGGLITVNQPILFGLCIAPLLGQDIGLTYS